MSRRRLLLINPTQWIDGRRKRGWSGNRFQPPLPLAYVAALTPADWEIRIIDENVEKFVPQAVDSRPDLVGITSLTATIPRAYDLAGYFRKQGIPVVIGGCHTSAVPEETVRYADVAVVGSAEGAWPELVDDFVRGRLKRIYDGGAPSLDRLPVPRRDLYPHRYYFDAVLTSRGCPYRCEFCSVWKTYDKRYQLRPVNAVLDELAQVRSRRIFFVDDNLTVDAKRTIELCKGMVDRGLKKRFAIQASMEVGQDEELLRWLQRAGCFLICIGVESVDESTLQQVRKVSNLKVGVHRFREVIDRIHAYGMAVSAGIILGHDADTLDTFRELGSFVSESGIDTPVFTILTPLPGTDLWDRLLAEGRLHTHHLPGAYTHFDAHHVTFQPLRVTADELLAAHNGAVRRTASTAALLRGLWRTWRRTGSLLAALASFQNSRWANINVRSS